MGNRFLIFVFQIFCFSNLFSLPKNDFDLQDPARICVLESSLTPVEVLKILKSKEGFSLGVLPFVKDINLSGLLPGLRESSLEVVIRNIFKCTNLENLNLSSNFSWHNSLCRISNYASSEYAVAEVIKRVVLSKVINLDLSDNTFDVDGNLGCRVSRALSSVGFVRIEGKKDVWKRDCVCENNEKAMHDSSFYSKIRNRIKG